MHIVNTLVDIDYVLRSFLNRIEAKRLVARVCLFVFACGYVCVRVHVLYLVHVVSEKKYLESMSFFLYV